jgi:hypothetical protein
MLIHICSMQSEELLIVSEEEMKELVRQRLIRLMEDLEVSPGGLGALCGKDRQTIEKAVCPKKNQSHSILFIAEICHGAKIELNDFYNFKIPLCPKSHKV